MDLSFCQLKALALVVLIVSLCVPSSEAKPFWGFGKSTTPRSSGGYGNNDDTTEPVSNNNDRGNEGGSGGGSGDREVEATTLRTSHTGSNDGEQEVTSHHHGKSTGGGEVESALSSGIGSVLLTKLLNSDTLGTAQLLRNHPTLKAILSSAIASGILTKLLSHKAETGEGSDGETFSSSSSSSGAWKAALESGAVSGILSKLLGSGLLGHPSSNEAAGYSGVAGALLQKFATG